MNANYLFFSVFLLAYL